MVVLGGGAFFYERGTPVLANSNTALGSYGWPIPRSLGPQSGPVCPHSQVTPVCAREGFAGPLCVDNGCVQ